MITFELNLENMRAFMTVKTALDRPCPFCAAKSGQACKTLRGRKVRGLHKTRWLVRPSGGKSG
jgi:hypothetical protein